MCCNISFANSILRFLFDINHQWSLWFQIPVSKWIMHMRYDQKQTGLKQCASLTGGGCHLGIGSQFLITILKWFIWMHIYGISINENITFYLRKKFQLYTKQVRVCLEYSIEKLIFPSGFMLDWQKTHSDRMIFLLCMCCIFAIELIISVSYWNYLLWTQNM